MELKEGFDRAAKDYDAQRRKLIPCFDDFYTLPFLLTDCKKPAPRVLDIGGGTGLFSYFLLLKYPQASITLIDVSGQMLDVAKKRFAAKEGFEYIVADYTEYEFEHTYDMVISALSIHHLDEEKKQGLYETCYGLLDKQGIFINADQVLSPSPELERQYQEFWMQFVRQSGISEQQINTALARTKHDDPSLLEQQLGWLRQAGFRSVDCIYKYLHFCVMVALK